MAIDSNTNLQNSYVTAISTRTTELLASKFIIPEILAPIEDLRPERVGNTVRVLRDPKGTVRDVSDDLSTDNTYDQPAQTPDEVSLDYYRTIGFNWGQKDQVIADEGITIERYSKSGSLQLASDIETKTLADIANDANIPTANEVGTVGTPLNKSALSTLVQKFIEDEVEMEDRVLILSPLHYKEALDNEVFTSDDFVSKGAIESGVLSAQLYGMTIYVTPRLASNDNLASVTGTDTTQISLALSKKSVLFTMAPIERPASPYVQFAQENIAGFMAAAYIDFDYKSRTNLLSMDTLFGVKVVKHPTTTNSSDITAVYPVLGGV